MKAVILAAGIASRLRPLTDNTPKCLLTVGKKTILGRTLDNLLQNNIKDLVVVTGYLQNQIIEFINSNYPQFNVTFIYNEKYESTNNIYSLWMTKEEIVGNDMLLLDSDILFDGKIIRKLLDSKIDNCLAVRSDHKLGEEEIKITLQQDKSIAEISKEVVPSTAIGESIGIELFGKNFVNELFIILDKMILGEQKVNIFYEAAFQRAINNGGKIYPVDVDGLKCMELDTADDIEAAKDEVIEFLD